MNKNNLKEMNSTNQIIGERNNIFPKFDLFRFVKLDLMYFYTSIFIHSKF